MHSVAAMMYVIVFCVYSNSSLFCYTLVGGCGPNAIGDILLSYYPCFRTTVFAYFKPCHLIDLWHIWSTSMLSNCEHMTQQESYNNMLFTVVSVLNMWQWEYLCEIKYVLSSVVTVITFSTLTSHLTHWFAISHRPEMNTNCYLALGLIHWCYRSAAIITTIVLQTQYLRCLLYELNLKVTLMSRKRAFKVS